MGEKNLAPFRRVCHPEVVWVQSAGRITRIRMFTGPRPMGEAIEP
jgi:hypothetical protein